MSDIQVEKGSFYDLEIKTAQQTRMTLDPYRGQVLLIVNTASQCGFTPQYEALETLYKRYHEKGFEILAFPCNQFGGQEPGSDSDIEQFCQLNFHTTFPLFSKIEVNGEGAHPLFRYLKRAAPGLLGTEAIKWNFTKFLVGRDGEVEGRYSPKVSPLKMAKSIEKLLED